MRDAKIFQIYEGTSQIQRLIIAKEIFLRERAGSRLVPRSCQQAGACRWLGEHIRQRGMRLKRRSCRACARGPGLRCSARRPSAVALWDLRDLPRFDRLTDYAAQARHASHHRRMARRSAPSSTSAARWCRWSASPSSLRQAVVSAEDKDFYTRAGGVSFTGILRALRQAPLSAGRVEGGSTITQQVVKTFLLSPERTFSRKLREMVLAERISAHLSQRRDPLPVPEPDLLRAPPLRRRGGRALLLRQARLGAQPGRGRHCWRGCRSRRRPTRPSTTPRPPSGASSTCCTACRRTGSSREPGGSVEAAPGRSRCNPPRGAPRGLLPRGGPPLPRGTLRRHRGLRGRTDGDGRHGSRSFRRAPPRPWSRV